MNMVMGVAEEVAHNGSGGWGDTADGTQRTGAPVGAGQRSDDSSAIERGSRRADEGMIGC